LPFSWDLSRVRRHSLHGFTRQCVA
jgi:hypothetical protein